MKNKLTDLNNHLFAQLERLGDEDIKDEALAVEVTRARAMSDVSKQIIDNAKLTLDAMRAAKEYGFETLGADMLGLEKK